MGHQKKTLIKKSTATAMAVLLSISLGVSAVAYWSATGTGTGTAQTTSGDTSVVITQTSVVNDLEPGKTIPDNIVGTLSPPPSGGSIFIGTVTPSVTGTSNPACGPENFVTQPSVVNTEVSSTVTGVSLGTVVFNDSMSVNQNICKGVTVYLSYTSSAWRGVGAPSQPTNLIGTAGNGEVGLSWTSPSSTGGTTITGYLIQYSTDGGNWTTATSSTGSTSTTYSVTGLTNGTPYWFRVAAVGTLTGATLTGNLATTTAAVTPYTSPSAPIALSGTKGNGKVDLSWTAGSNGGSVITGYRVQYSTDGSNWTTKTTNTGSSLPSYSVTGLTNGTPYYFQVSATNAAGTGPPAYIGSTPAPGDTVTPYTNPDAPTSFTATPSNGAASLSWTAPTNTGGKAITGYEVQRSTDGTTWTTLSSTITGTSYTASGLTNGTPYYFQVAALNDSTSISEWASVTTTPFTAPGTPTALTATPSDSQVVLNWTAPDNGGKAIMGYQVQYTATPSDASSWTTAISNTNTTATTYTVTGLTNGAPGYSFRIAAINNATSDGVGTMSSWTSAVTATPYAVPDAASDVQGATSSGNIALTWNAPSNTGGLPITGYQIQISTDGTTWNNDVANTNSADNTPVPTSYIVTADNTGAALSGTQGYYFRVLTITGTGTSPGGAVSGPSLASPELYAQSVPDAPTALTVVPGDSSAQLSWTAPANNGGNAITGYSVSYSTDGSTWTTATANNTLSSSGPVPTSYTVTGLTNGTAYYFKVAALNGLGSSAATSTTSTYTPAKPTAAITAPANAGVSATWDGVISGTATANAGTTLTGVNLYIQKDGGTYWNGSAWVSGATSVTPTGTTTWSYTLPSGAFDGSAHTYNFSAVATNNASANSAAATATYTLYPTAPTAAISYPTAGTTYGPDWTGSIAGTATLYEPASLVTLSTVNVTVEDTTSSQYWNGSSWQTGATTVPASIASGTDQTSGGNYADTLYNWTYSMPGADFTSQSHDNFSVTAAATDSVGNSITTSSTAFGYYYSAPTAVTGVTSTVGNGQVVLNWTTPTDNGNASITGYQVQDSTDGTTWTTVAANTASTSPTYTATGLTNGTTYYFRVAAINAVGASAAGYVGSASSPGNPSTPFTVPGAPSITTGTVGNGQITLAWTAPTVNGGLSVTGYQVQYSTDGSTWTTAASNTGSTSTSYTVTGLTNGTPYYFQVAAINHLTTDLGAFSSSFGPVAPYTTAGAPTGATATSGSSTQVPVSWTAPSSNGGTAITGYAVRYSSNGGTTWTTATTSTGSTTTNYTVTGLTNGTSYIFQVAAVNAAGTSAFSAASSTATPYTTPSAPTGVTGPNYSNGQVALSWALPSSTGGNAITGYAVQYSTDGTNWTTATANTGSTTRAYTVTGLTNGTSYYFQVAAVNAAGAGVFSSSSTLITPGVVATAPATLSATAGQNVSIPLSWSAPSSNGGLAITGYQIQYSVNSGSTWSNITANTGSTATTYNWTSSPTPANGTSYNLRVAAINAAGTGAYEYVTNTTTSPGTTTTPYTTPDTPTGVTGASSLNAHVSLTWSAPASNGNAISGYAVQYSSDGGSTWTSATTNSGSTSASYNVTGLTNGTSYTFQVAAINAAGQGSWSASSAAYTPATNPTAPIITGTSGSLSSFAPGVAYDSSGNAYVADTYNNRVVKVTPGGTQTTVFTITSPDSIAVDSSGNIYVTSGLNVIEYSTGGAQSTLWTATSYQPAGVAVDSVGNVYVADANAGVFEIPAGGGTATAIGSGFSYAIGVAVDSSGNVYVADRSSGLLRITGGTTATIDALSGLNATGLAEDSSGNVYVSTYYDHAIRKYVNTSGTLGSPSIVAAGISQSAGISGIAINPTNNDLVATSSNSSVLSDLTAGAAQALPVVSNGQVTVSWNAPASSGGPAITSYTAHAGSFTCTTSTTSCTITGLTNGSSYSVYVTATNGGSLTSPSAYAASVVPAAAPSAPQSLVATGTNNSATLAWTAPSTSNGAAPSSYQVQYSTDGSVWNTFTPATPLDGSARTTSVTGLSNGTSYYFRVAAISSAGTGAYEYATSTTSSPGTATLVGTVPSAPTLTGLFGQVSGSANSMTFDSSGNAYVVSSAAGTVTKITPSGTATVLGFTGLSNPQGVAVDSSGNVYVADYANNRIEELSTGGTQSQYMSFYLPTAIAFDSSGNFYVGNAANTSIAEYTSTGTPIGTWGSGLAKPYGIAIDSSGNLYVSDTNNNRVVKVTPGGVQTTIGPNFSAPAGIAVDSSGNVYEGDTNNHVVSKITPSGTTSNVSTGFMTGGAVGVDPSNNVYVGNLSGAILNATTNGSKFTGQNGSITLTWAAPVSNNGSAVTGYTVTDGVGQGCTTTTATQCTITGLTAGLFPAFTVSATNAFGTSATTSLPRMASYTAPNPPTAFVENNNSTQVSLSWTKAVNSNSYVTTYNVQQSTDGTNWTDLANLASTATSYTASGLTNGTPYYFRIGAVSPYGVTYVYNGSSSPGTSVTPNGALITTPANGSTYGAVAFPTFSGTATPSTGATVSSVKLSIHDNNNNQYWTGTAWQTGATTVTATGTTSWTYNGISYSNLTNAHVYSVVATMSDSASANLSGPATSFTYSTVNNPGAITTPVASTTYGANLTAASGTTPSGTTAAGLTIYDSSFHLYWSGSAWQSALVWDTVGITQTGTTWSGTLPTSNMTNGHTFVINYVNINALGNFGTSPTVAFVYDASVPTVSLSQPASGSISTAAWDASGTTVGHAVWAPSGINGTASAAATGATVSSVTLVIKDTTTGNYWNGTGWQSGSTYVTAYGTTTWWLPQSLMPSSSFALSGANYGDTFTVTPTVNDSAGNSTVSSATTFSVGQVPGAVSSFNVAQTGALSNTATFGAASGGQGTTSYSVQYSTNGTTWSTLGGTYSSPLVLNDSYSCFIVCGYIYATPGTTVYWAVQTSNAYGTGPITYLGSSSSPGTSLPFINAPAGMTGGIAATAGNGSMALNWTSSAPTPTAASPVSSYTVQYSTDGTNWTTDTTDCTSTATTCTVTGLVNGTPYYFKVTPNNVVGSGAAAYVGSTTSPGSTITPYTVPSAVTGSGISATSALTGNETVSWSAPSTGGTAITGYAVRYSTNGTAWTTATSNTGSASTSYTVTGLTSTTAYYFQVAAINAAGTGSYGATSSTYYPAAPTVAVTSPSTAVGPSWGGTLSGTTALGAAGTTITGVNVSVNGTNVSESGAATLGTNSWSYTVDSGDLTNITQTSSGNYTVTVTVTDSAGNTGTTTYTLVANLHAVTATIASPVSGTTYTYSSSSSGTVWPGSSQFSGTATVNQSSDLTNSLASLNVRIVDSTAQNYAWNGSSWVHFNGSISNAATAPATIGSGTSGVYNWTYTLPSSALTNGHSYFATAASGSDARGNTLPSPPNNTTFTYTYSAPTAPSAVTPVTATGTAGQLSATWTAAGDGGGTLSGYQIQVSTDGTNYYIANNNTGSTSLTANISSYCTTWSGGTPGSGTCTASQPLSDSSSYYVKVAGINQLGTGTLSAASTAATPMYTMSGSSYLIVAAGGGAGGTFYSSSASQYYKGGGGGAGGIFAGGWSPSAGYAFNITVGTGGAAGAAGSNAGSNGGNSTLFLATATGGGGGGGGDPTNAPAIQSGAAGGSGGGAGHGPTTGVTGGTSTYGQGNNGGAGSNSATYYSGAGGGGWYSAGTAAGAGSTPAGGSGATWSTLTSLTPCTTGTVGTATACYGVGGNGNSGTAVPSTQGSGGSSTAGSGSVSKAGEPGSNGVVGIFVPSAYLGSAGSVSFSAGCTTTSLTVSTPTAGTAYFVTGTSGSCTFTYNPAAGTTTISTPGSGALGSISSFAGTLAGSTTASNGSLVPSTTNAVTLTIKDTTANSGAGAWWNGSSWQSTATTVNATVASPGSATSTWSYAIAAANFTSGHGYNITANGTDSGGATSTSTATTFTASGF